MESSEFVLLVWDNVWQFSAILIFSFLFYYVLLKPYFTSVFDPLIFGFVFSAIGFATNVFLVIQNLIDQKFAILYFGSQLLFFLGFYLFKPIKVTSQKFYKDAFSSFRTMKIFYFLSATFVIFGQLAIYAFKGIPLFAESRLNVVGDSGLFTLILRIVDTFSAPVLILTYYFIFSNQSKFVLRLLSKLILFCFILFAVLNGSKSSIIAFAVSFFVYSLYAMKEGILTPYLFMKKYSFTLFVVSVFGALIVILLSESDANAFAFLMYRILISGDAYYMSFPNDVLDNFISQENWFVNLFASPLSMCKLISESQVPEPLGFLLMKYHYKADLFKGPNPRMAIFGYVYIGYYGTFIYAFLIGGVLSFIRNKLYYLLSPGPLGLVIYVSLLYPVVKIEADFHNALAGFINFIPLYFLLLGCTFLSSIVKRNYTKC